MRKRIISLFIALSVAVSFALPSFAAGWFNKSVFNGRSDIIVSYDDIAATTFVYPNLDMFGPTFINLENGMIFVEPSIGIVDSSEDSLDAFVLNFRYFGNDWVNLNTIWIKVGNNRYSFRQCKPYQSIFEGSLCHECIGFPLKNETLPFIQDFVQHQNEEIKVRLEGDDRNFDFVLTTDMKNCIICMYNLFVSGGGTRKSNLDNITPIDSVVIERNYQRIY